MWNDMMYKIYLFYKWVLKDFFLNGFCFVENVVRYRLIKKRKFFLFLYYYGSIVWFEKLDVKYRL